MRSRGDGSVSIYFYDEASLTRALAPLGAATLLAIDEPAAGHATFPFLMATCRAPVR